MLRGLDLAKPPGVAEAISWASALHVLGAAELDAARRAQTMGAVLKYAEDIRTARAAEFAAGRRPRHAAMPDRERDGGRQPVDAGLPARERRCRRWTGRPGRSSCPVRRCTAAGRAACRSRPKPALRRRGRGRAAGDQA